MKTEAFLKPDGSIVPTGEGFHLGDEALVKSDHVNRLREAATALNIQLARLKMIDLPFDVSVAVMAWREVWEHVDGKPLPLPEGPRNAHSYDRRRR